MSRWIPTAIVVLVLLGLGGWHFGLFSSRSDSSDLRPSSDGVASSQQDADLLGEEVGEAQSSPERRPPEPPMGQPETGQPSSVLTGRLVHRDGTPIPDQTVVSQEARRLDGAERSRVTGRSDEQGRFALRLNPWPGPRVVLEVKASPQVQRRYLHLGGGEFPPLRHGLSDLGTIVCDVGWSVTGQVLDPLGAPIEQARVALGNGVWNWVAHSDGEGRLAFHGLPQGEYSNEIHRAGFVATEVPAVQVGPGENSEGLVWRMEAVGSIEGHVVDEAGDPVEGAQVRWMSPGQSTRWGEAMGRTDRLGRFSVQLVAHGDHSLTITHPEFVTHAGQATYRAGDEDLQFTLKRASLQAFQVISKETEQPIERYSLQVSGRGRVPAPPALAAHPSGITRVQVTPGQSSLTVRAPGYVTDRRKAPATPSEKELIVLESEWSTRGRLLWMGEPVVGGTVEMTPAKVAGASPKDSPRGVRSKAAREALAQQLSRSDRTQRTWRVLGSDVRMATTDSEGRFFFTGLADPSYRLHASIWGQAGRTEPVRFGQQDLGDLELSAVGSIEGQLLLPPSLPSHLIRMRVGSTRVTVAPNGSFALAHVEAGSYPVSITPIRDVFPGFQGAGMEAPVIGVQAGEVTQATIDMRDAVLDSLPRLDLRVAFGGEPAAGLRMLWGTPGSSSRRSLGKTDSQGRLQVLAPRTPFVLWTPTGLLPGVGPLDLQQSGSHEVFVDVPAGQLHVQIPEGLTLPEHGQWMIGFTGGRKVDSLFGALQALDIRRGQLQPARLGGIDYDPATRTVHVRGLLPGECHAQVHLSGPGGDFLEGSAPPSQLYRAEEALSIQAGEITHWTLPIPPRKE